MSNHPKPATANTTPRPINDTQRGSREFGSNPGPNSTASIRRIRSADKRPITDSKSPRR